jgi:hypothetical protein
MKNQAEEVTNLVEKEVAFLERMKADADKTATALIQAYLGPDHKIIDMAKFHAGLSQALRQARERGQVDKSGDVVTLL